MYFYTGRTLDGSAVRGALRASSRSIAMANLRTRAMFVTSLAASKSVSGAWFSAIQFGPVSQHHLATFFRSFATLVSAGVPLKRALEVSLQQCADRRLQEALRAILNDIELGASLGDSMARRPREFSTLFVAMVRAGEAGGVLDEVLERLASFLERERSLKKKLAGALAYPAIVATAAMALSAFLFATILPLFGSMFAQYNLEVPASTRILLAIAAHFRVWLCLSGAALCAILASAVIFRRRERFRFSCDNLVLHLPVVGSMIRKAALARIARMLGVLLRSGVGFLFALDVVIGVAGNAVYQSALRSAQAALREGSAFAPLLREQVLFDSLAVQLVSVGEETGTLDRMLMRLADYYEGDVEAALATLSATLEPALMLLLGSVVGFIVFSIFLPLYTLIGRIQ